MVDTQVAEAVIFVDKGQNIDEELMLAKQLNFTASTKAKQKYESILNETISEVIRLARKAADLGEFKVRYVTSLNEHLQHFKADLTREFLNDGFEVYINDSVRNPHTDNVEWVYDITLRWEKAYDDHSA